LSQLFQELKRRNVFRVVLAYLAVGWLVLQVVQLVLESTSAPDWVMQVFLLAIAVGFPFAVLFAWAFEMTPQGIKLQKEVDRDQSITQTTGRKLNRTIIIVLVTAVAFLLVDKFVLQGSSAPTVAATDKSVAVLPFVAMSSGPDDEYFADGLTEEILNSLTRVPELLVTARTSAFHFKGQDIPIPEIAATLGVAHIVEGSVRRAGERLRVTAQLIRADDGFHLWSETYDHDTSDAFGVQTDIAEKIASALDVVLDDEQLQEMRSVGLQNPEAYVAFQKGVELFNNAHGAEDQLEKLLAANEWFEETMSLAPEFSDSYGYHADYFTHVLSDAADAGLSESGPSVDELNAAMSSLEADLTKAMRYAPDEGRRDINAYDLDLITGRWRGLSSRFDQIVEQGGCYQANWYELINSPFGDAAEVLQISQRAIECDPLSFSGWMTSATASQWLGDFELAIETSRLGLETTGHRILIALLVESLIGAGHFEEATTIIEREYRTESGQLLRLLKIAAAQGDESTTKALLAEYESVATGRSSLMIAAAVAGQREMANEIAAAIDSAPFGYLNLIRALHGCTCGAPFDLEATPGFAKRIADAELFWPPLSPMTWPLKDW
jgi:TolB-like protein